MEEQTNDKMGRKFAKMEERLKKMALEMEALQRDNEALKCQDVKELWAKTASYNSTRSLKARGTNSK